MTKIYLTSKYDSQTIIKGDCLKVLKKIPAKSIDVIVTSPPYNIGIKYNTYYDNKDLVKYLKWLTKIARQLRRVLKTKGSLFLNIGSTSVNPWITTDVSNIFRRYFILQNNIIWVKSISINKETKGHFKPINSKRFLNNNQEAIFHFTKTGNVLINRLAIGVPYTYKSNIKRFNQKQDKRCIGNVWFIPYKTINSKTQKFNHPATFPINLVRRCLRLHGNLKGTVLDPFLGTGTTLIAAKSLGMKGIGIEIDSTYVKIAVKRLKGFKS